VLDAQTKNRTDGLILTWQRIHAGRLLSSQPKAHHFPTSGRRKCVKPRQLLKRLSASSLRPRLARQKSTALTCTRIPCADRLGPIPTAFDPNRPLLYGTDKLLFDLWEAPPERRVVEVGVRTTSLTRGPG